MLDAEVAHVGDPALDVAYLSTHLACKGVKRPELATSLDGARRAFERAYRADSDLIDVDTWDRHTGAILAGRVRGVSRVTYLDPDQELFVLGLATGLVRGEVSLDEVWEQILAG
jgi:aminoglycoside phosphotransferase (APT) family kinase protein